jgi:hypothetical protein
VRSAACLLLRAAGAAGRRPAGTAATAAVGAGRGKGKAQAGVRPR